ncbi:MAG: hypothetical protein V7L26_12125 [Nostoc sp.]|uniref:hypothetical protein n=1 Tax=Nostoc sp. TaxID=1180 RepID=UPI002FF3ACF8
MTTYCVGCKKATVTILNPPFTMGFDAPVTIEVASGSTTFTHDMRSAINQSFSQIVTSVELSPSGQTYSNGALNNPVRDCPIPGILGRNIASDFDNYYPDNSGSCTYQVNFGGLVINGFAFPSVDGQYTVACDNDCPPGTCKCHSDRYPGYCCNDCGSTSAQINAITQLVKAKNHGR